MRNFHVPLPDQTYAELFAEAERTGRPATILVRQVIRAWLRHRRKLVRAQEIARFATEHAGTALDLDPALEAAAVEHLMDSEPEAG